MSNGFVYKRGKSKYYWIQYYRNGRRYRESSKSTKKMVAEKLLARRMGDIAQGKVPGIHFDKITFKQLADDFIRDYQINEKKSLKRAKQSIKHLTKFFEDYKVPEITTPKIREYIGMRLEEGVSNGTINRELSALKRALNIGAEQTPPAVDRVPHIPMLKENNVRKGFFEHGEFEALYKVLPDYIKGISKFAYSYGWRFNEITGLTWSHVDREQGIVRLEVGETKNDDGRTIYLDEELKAVFDHQWEMIKKREIITPYVFPNKNGDGRIKDIRGSWYKACEVAGIGKRFFHDFRRTAVRNMVRAGISERVAMMVSGHKTRSIFDRYNITNNSDLKMASQKQAEYRKSLTATFSATVADFPTKKGLAKTG
ncbi:Phage integrase SAM-like domain [Desulfonema limicola]|uniref:Phage integrase SAM-like domain n=1 Tax=Desulfonema limicola TaxID=45656 RepID=A0A975BCB4_9BACT|nr:site-specific integrase [Desulfonema limicola]QTA82742.1 Phage integrase SAM-like domain [Desulfonema limicola]